MEWIKAKGQILIRSGIKGREKTCSKGWIGRWVVTFLCCISAYQRVARCFFSSQEGRGCCTSKTYNCVVDNHHFWHFQKGLYLLLHYRCPFFGHRNAAARKQKMEWTSHALHSKLPATATTPEIRGHNSCFFLRSLYKVRKEVFGHLPLKIS